MDNRKTVLEVNDLVVSFSMYKKGFRKENLEVIHSLSIDVKEKEIVAIVGSSGSGKSLLHRRYQGYCLAMQAQVEVSAIWGNSWMIN